MYKEFVSIAGKDYPVVIEGSGIPCLVIGNGALTLKTTSKNFKQHFKVYGSDLYFDSNYALTDIKILTIDKIIDDVVALSKALQLKDFVIWGHSAFGIIALELMKKYPALVKAAIIVGTSVNVNPEMFQRYQQYFDKYAEPERKKIDAARRGQIAEEDLSKLNPSERFLREYIFRDAPRYWSQPDYDCTHIWQGIQVDAAFDYFYLELLANIDVRKNLSSIHQPIFLAAGIHDYDSCPVHLWREVKDLPSKMQLKIFEKSGHYPHYEEADLFDQHIKEWIETLC